jgi:hypothetical protein
MLYLKAFAFSIFDLAFTIFVCLLVNWWAPLFADKEGNLPSWLNWVHTFDANLDRGVDDGFFKGPYSYWNRVKWLYRNPAYGFSFFALGMPYKASEWKLKEYTPAEGDKPSYFFAYTDSGHFNTYFVKFGIRFKIGWKAWNNFDVNTRKFCPSQWAKTGYDLLPFVFSISKYNGS